MDSRSTRGYVVQLVVIMAAVVAIWAFMLAGGPRWAGGILAGSFAQAPPPAATAASAASPVVEATPETTRAPAPKVLPGSWPQLRQALEELDYACTPVGQYTECVDGPTNVLALTGDSPDNVPWLLVTTTNDGSRVAVLTVIAETMAGAERSPAVSAFVRRNSGREAEESFDGVIVSMDVGSSSSIIQLDMVVEGFGEP